MQWDKFEGCNGLPSSTGCLRGGSLWICVMFGKLSLFPFSSSFVTASLSLCSGRAVVREAGDWCALGSCGQGRVMYENLAAVHEGSGLENKRLHTHIHTMACQTM